MCGCGCLHKVHVLYMCKYTSCLRQLIFSPKRKNCFLVQLPCFALSLGLILLMYMYTTEAELPCPSGERRPLPCISFKDLACPAELPQWISW